MARAVVQQESFTIEIEHQTRDLYENLEHMKKEPLLCDVTLMAKDIEIPAHKTILASCSPYFYSIFTNVQTAKQKKIILDVKPQILLAIVNYMYTSKLTVLEDDIVDLLHISNMLLLNRVQLECCNLLKRITNPNNCLVIKNVALKYKLTDLLNNTSSYIEDNFDDVVTSEEFLSLTGDEISKLISKDTLKVSSEEKIFESMVGWINHDPKGRRKYLRHLMGYVRLEFIARDYLKQHIINHPLLVGDIVCKDLIIKALLKENKMKTICRRYANGKALLIVGGSLSEAGNNLEYYNPDKTCWSKALEMPFNVRDFGLAAINEKAYVISGVRDMSVVGTVNCYDIGTNSWEKVSDLTTKRYAHAAAVLKNCIYVLGGVDGYRILNCAEKFNIYTQKWNSVPPMLRERCYFGVDVLNDILYAVGGTDDLMSTAAFNFVECYNHRTDTWKELCGMHHRRRGLGVCAFDGKLYAIGGRTGRECLSSVEKYDPGTDSWKEVAPMNIARAQHGVAVVDNKIYVIGGFNINNSSLNSIEVYDKITNSWTILPESMNVARCSHGVALLTRIFNLP